MAAQSDLPLSECATWIAVLFGGIDSHLGASIYLQIREPVIQCAGMRVGGGHGDATRVFLR